MISYGDFAYKHAHTHAKTCRCISIMTTDRYSKLSRECLISQIYYFKMGQIVGIGLNVHMVISHGDFACIHTHPHMQKTSVTKHIFACILTSDSYTKQSLELLISKIEQPIVSIQLYIHIVILYSNFARTHTLPRTHKRWLQNLHIYMYISI